MENKQTMSKVTLKSGIKIPKDLLQEADSHPAISGFVFPDEDRNRVAIHYGDELVGFMTPRNDSSGWRVGAIYVKPEHSGKGIASEAISQFMKGKASAPTPIDVKNVSSRKSFQRAGYETDGKEYQWKDGGGKYHIWKRKKP